MPLEFHSYHIVLIKREVFVVMKIVYHTKPSTGIPKF